MRYTLIVAGANFMLITGLSNEIGLSLNPLFYLPISIVSFRLGLETLVLGLAVPIVMGFLGFYAANHAVKHIAGETDAETQIEVELQMVKPKQIVFEV